jgi:hypothetical protein
MKYIKIYNKIVEHRLSNIPENTYTEKHHIIPKCLNGTNNPDNLVKVTTKEHYILHHLLTKIYPENSSLKYAFRILKNKLNIEKSKNPYSCIRKCEYSSENHPSFGKPSPTKGKTLSEEHRRKLSLSHIGKTFSEEHRRKLSLAKTGENHPFYGKVGPNKGKTHTEETKLKMSKSRIGKPSPTKGKTLSKESKQKISESRNGKIIVNNGIIAKLVYPDNIPEGFVKGRLKKTYC